MNRMVMTIAMAVSCGLNPPIPANGLSSFSAPATSVTGWVVRVRSEASRIKRAIREQYRRPSSIPSLVMPPYGSGASMRI